MKQWNKVLRRHRRRVSEFLVILYHIDVRAGWISVHAIQHLLKPSSVSSPFSHTSCFERQNMKQIVHNWQKKNVSLKAYCSFSISFLKCDMSISTSIVGARCEVPAVMRIHNAVYSSMRLRCPMTRMIAMLDLNILHFLRIMLLFITNKIYTFIKH